MRHVETMDLEIEVWREENRFLLQTISGQRLASYTVLFRGGHAELKEADVSPEAWGQRLTEKFCWFLQTRLNHKIMFGNQMSDDAIALARSLGNSKRFKLFWVKGDEKQRFDSDEEIGDEASPTGWRLIAESSYPQQPMLTEGHWRMEYIYNLFADY